MPLLWSCRRPPNPPATWLLLARACMAFVVALVFYVFALACVLLLALVLIAVVVALLIALLLALRLLLALVLVAFAFIAFVFAAAFLFMACAFVSALLALLLALVFMAFVPVLGAGVVQERASSDCAIPPLARDTGPPVRHDRIKATRLGEDYGKRY